MRKVMLLHTGGTIGMVQGPRGLTPDPNFADRLATWLGRSVPHLAVQIEALHPLFDSADVSYQRWFQIAGLIHSRHQAFDAIVVLHGTDTLAYTASALSFLLLGLNKPVVLTGAQVPWANCVGDARQNLLDALTSAQSAALLEVCIAFDRRVLRGNRAVKTSTFIGDGFASPHWPALASFGEKLEVTPAALLAQRPAALATLPPVLSCAGAGLIKVYPGLSADVIRAAADAHPAGLVLELFGSGTAPTGELSHARLFGMLASRNIALVGVSQSLRGRVEGFPYASSSVLGDWGVIPGHDLTAEAALAKLTYLSSLAVPYDALRHRIAADVAGEVSRPAISS